MGSVSWREDESTGGATPLGVDAEKTYDLPEPLASIPASSRLGWHGCGEDGDPSVQGNARANAPRGTPEGANRLGS